MCLKGNKIYVPRTMFLWHKDYFELQAFEKKLIQEIERNPKTTKVNERFEPLQQKVIDALTPQDGYSDYIHQLSNMALLSSWQNSAVSNYAFEAKRNLVIEMDKKGLYIPFCTKMVFMKYYSTEETNIHFWGKHDRDDYVKSIYSVLANYIPNEK